MSDVFAAERAVESMVAAGRKVMDAAVAEYRPHAIVAAFSGGNDSVVSTHFAVTHYGVPVVHCDTRVGLARAASHVRATAGKFGWDLMVGRADPEGPRGTKVETLPNGRWEAGETAYEEFVLNNGFPGPAQHHRVYQRLKERSLRRLARELCPRGGRLLVVSGIRHDESSVRAGYKRESMAQEKTKLVWTNPFYWQSAADFEAYREEFSLPRNPVKALIGISAECCCGAFCKPGEREAIRSVDPEFSGYIDGLEARVRANGFPWSYGGGAAGVVDPAAARAGVPVRLARRRPVGVPADVRRVPAETVRT